jgi:secreted PhoX family phosphatase
MLMIDAKPGFDTRKGQQVGAALSCRWVAIDDPDPVSAATNDLAVYESGKAKGAATFGRLEGAWFGNGSVYMSATSGGDAGLGQVWRYIPSETGGTLVLLFESRDKKVLWSPDNLTVSRRGGIAVCEDTYGGNCHIRGLTPDGRIFDFAKNIYPGQEESEFAGVCYSPDGQTMFVNLQLPGVTCAIWGPWERGVL